MKRYKFTKTKIDSVSKDRHKITTHYPKIYSKDTDIIYRAKWGDTYTNLAHRFYDNQDLWWIIARANSPYSGQLAPKVGSKVIVPKEIGDILSDFEIMNKFGG
tara:strand:- start:4812 stop:5120 length:309 start_codon:yes stop_codon:yes gene_type:complete